MFLNCSAFLQWCALEWESHRHLLTDCFGGEKLGHFDSSSEKKSWNYSNSGVRGTLDTDISVSRQFKTYELMTKLRTPSIFTFMCSKNFQLLDCLKSLPFPTIVGTYAEPLILQLYATWPDGKWLRIQKIEVPTPWEGAVGGNWTDRCNRQSISPCLIEGYRHLIVPGCAGQPVATSLIPYS